MNGKVTVNCFIGCIKPPLKQYNDGIVKPLQYIKVYVHYSFFMYFRR